MSTHNIHLKYRAPKRYPTIISIMPPGMALTVTLRGSNYRCLEQIFMVPKGFEPSKFDCILWRVGALLFFYFAFLMIKKKQSRVFETGSVGLAETQLFLFTPNDFLIL